MKQQGNFLLLEQSEFRDWLNKQTVTRKIKTLQVHHTWKPNYSTRKNQDPFVCLEGMRRSHLASGWAATGQHFSILENGLIGVSLDRKLNNAPAGIKGANGNAICVEIIGDFDQGGDKIADDQKRSVTHVYACLADKFNIPINTSYIVYHAWYTANGTRLKDYTPGLSSKACPGTAFWGLGNTVASAKKGFLVDVQTEYNRLKGNIKEENEPMTLEERQMVKEIQEEVAKLKKRLNMESIPSYAKDSVVKLTKMKDKNGEAVVDTPEGRSQDFYAVVTVLDRAGLFEK